MNKLDSKIMKYSEFVNYVEKTDKSVDFKGSSNSDDDLKWAGGWTIKEAIEHARKGWDAGIKQLAMGAGKSFAGVGSVITEHYAGNRVNMGAYLRGEPKNMYRRRNYAVYDRDRITIYIPLAYGFSTTSEQALTVAVKYVKYINEMQVKNDIKVVGYFETTGHKNNWVINVNVILKDFGERLVLNNIAAALHSGFFRQMIVKYQSTRSYCDLAHGYPVNTVTAARRIKNDLIVNKKSKYVILNGVKENLRGTDLVYETNLKAK